MRSWEEREQSPKTRDVGSDNVFQDAVMDSCPESSYCELP
jgi:hypothetical protein